jgi:hypothetical protein
MLGVLRGRSDQGPRAAHGLWAWGQEAHGSVRAADGLMLPLTRRTRLESARDRSEAVGRQRDVWAVAPSPYRRTAAPCETAACAVRRGPRLPRRWLPWLADLAHTHTESESTARTARITRSPPASQPHGLARRQHEAAPRPSHRLCVLCTVRSHRALPRGAAPALLPSSKASLSHQRRSQHGLRSARGCRGARRRCLPGWSPRWSTVALRAPGP